MPGAHLNDADMRYPLIVYMLWGCNASHQLLRDPQTTHPVRLRSSIIAQMYYNRVQSLNPFQNSPHDDGLMRHSPLGYVWSPLDKISHIHTNTSNEKTHFKVVRRFKEVRRRGGQPLRHSKRKCPMKIMEH